MASLKKFFSRTVNKLLRISKLNQEYFKPSEKDIFLVSYPRSGNTWMRVMMAELIYGSSGESLADIECFIPDMHHKQEKNNVINDNIHIVKSHNLNILSNKWLFKKVIYIIRDPRDVVISFYRHKKARGYEHDLDTFIKDWLTGRIWPSSWQEHVNSWIGIGSEDLKTELCIIKYEDLLVNTENNLIRVMDFIGQSKTNQEISHAIEMASLKNMKTKEEKGQRKDQSVEGYNFIGKGKANQWEEKLSAQQLDLIYDYTSILMKKFNYL